MNFFSISAFILVVIIGCSNSKVNDKSVRTASYSKTQSVTVENDPQQFYIQFQKSLIDFDTINLIKMTVFPLKVWGFEDQDPKITINQNQFASKLKEIISHSVDYDLEKNESITTLDLFRANESINNIGGINQEENAFTIGVLDFEKVNGEWKLIRIYADTKPISK